MAVGFSFADEVEHGKRLGTRDTGYGIRETGAEASRMPRKMASVGGQDQRS